MISVYTPSHNPQWLNECYGSLQAQTFQDWQWVVLLNKDAEWTPPADERVVVYYSVLEGVGALKREAVSYCSGEIYVELDHDDILLPTALEEVKQAFDNGADFVYSDFAQINEDGTPNFDEFNSAHGWTYRDEGGYHVCNSMALHPHSVSFIWYAPNHLRAISSALYAKIGGYEANLDVLDDQDLMMKAYQEGTFTHIPKNLYLQRVHGQNTQAGELNAKIQDLTVRMYDDNIERAMLKWSADRNLLALDLGAAHNPAPGYKTVDMHGDPDYKGDIFDVLGSMPDNSVGLIRAVDFCEHIADKIRLWNELYRVLAHGGMVLSLTPSTDGRGAYQDPTHVAFYNENSFWYWTNEQYRKFVPEITAVFQASRLVSYFPSDWHRENHIPYVCANLIALKEQERFGGII